MSVLPYPPAPEFGWYADDNTVAGSETAAVANATTTSSTVQAEAQPAAQSYAQPAAQPATQPAPAPQPLAQAQPVQTITPQHEASEDDIEDWDSTVLSSSFTSKPKKVYGLHNASTGQDVILDVSVLLGRKPSEAVPEGAKAVRLEDPTRTISRNHAAISFDADGTLWIEDYGSLNGTYIIRDNEETKVEKGTPVKLEAPATVRIGDQFFELTERS